MHNLKTRVAWLSTKHVPETVCRPGSTQTHRASLQRSPNSLAGSTAGEGTHRERREREGKREVKEMKGVERKGKGQGTPAYIKALYKFAFFTLLYFTSFFSRPALDAMLLWYYRNWEGYIWLAKMNNSPRTLALNCKNCPRRGQASLPDPRSKASGFVPAHLRVVTATDLYFCTVYATSLSNCRGGLASSWFPWTL